MQDTARIMKRSRRVDGEAVEGLAPTVVQELFSVFDRPRGEVCIVIVEHHLDLVLALADRDLTFYGVLLCLAATSVATL